MCYNKLKSENSQKGHRAMKNFNKILSLVLAVILVAGLVTGALAVLFAS